MSDLCLDLAVRPKYCAWKIIVRRDFSWRNNLLLHGEQIFLRIRIVKFGSESWWESNEKNRQRTFENDAIIAFFGSPWRRLIVVNDNVIPMSTRNVAHFMSLTGALVYIYQSKCVPEPIPLGAIFHKLVFFSNICLRSQIIIPFVPVEYFVCGAFIFVFPIRPLFRRFEY